MRAMIVEKRLVLMILMFLILTSACYYPLSAGACVYRRKFAQLLKLARMTGHAFKKHPSSSNIYNANTCSIARFYRVEYFTQGRLKNPSASANAHSEAGEFGNLFSQSVVFFNRLMTTKIRLRISAAVVFSPLA